MKHHPVKLFTDADRKIAIDPSPVRVNPGDTIAWRSDEGAIAVSFIDAPLDALQFSAKRHEATQLAHVRKDAPRGKSFSCTASIDGKQAPAIYGIVIEP
jgi:plastocyanin